LSIPAAGYRSQSFYYQLLNIFFLYRVKAVIRAAMSSFQKNKKRFPYRLNRLSFPEEIISKTLWISAVLAVAYFNRDDTSSGPQLLSGSIILINVLLPFTPYWKSLVLERPKSLLRTDRKMQQLIYIILYIILICFLIKKAVVWSSR